MQPADIANRSLDALGVPASIGDLQDGSREAQVLLRHYGATLRQLSRSANWNGLRRRAPLRLLQDATGYTTQQQVNNNMPVTVGTGTPGMKPWIYEYAYPVDCVKVRFVPRDTTNVAGQVPQGNISIPTTPLFPTQANIAYAREVPTRFLVTQDIIPNLIGAPTSWAQIPDTSQTMGQGLTSQSVILTNSQCAAVVYTALVTYPDQWDPLFTEAFVAALAVRVAMQLVPDRKAAVAVRNEQMAVAKAALDQARVQDGQETWTNTDSNPDWLRIRNSNAWGGASNYYGGGLLDGPGTFYGGWDSYSFGGNSSAY